MTDWISIGLTAVVSAIVSLATTLVLRWWDKRRVAWVVVGEAHVEYFSGKKTGRIRLNLVLYNSGDGDAFDVRLRRCNGGSYQAWTTYEAGRIAAGEQIDVGFSISPENLDSAWMQVIFRTSPTGRSRPKTSERFALSKTFADVHDWPPSDGSRALGGSRRIPE